MKLTLSNGETADGKQVGYYLRTRRTRARVAEYQALVPAVGPQSPPARVSAGVRHAPGVERRVDHLAAIAGVARRDGRRGICLAAVGASPDYGEGPLSACVIVLQILEIEFCRFLTTMNSVAWLG